MKMIRTIICLLLLPMLSHASAYWLEVKGSGKVNEPVTIQVCYGYIDDMSIRHRDTGKELQLTGEFKITVISEAGSRTPVQLHQTADCWEGTFTPSSAGAYQVLGINDSHPVVDRSKTGGKNVRPVDFLCAAYQAASANSVTKPAQYLDIVASVGQKLVTVKAFNNDKKADAGTKLRVFNPENWEKELTIDDNGEASFMPTIKGLYIIREDWTDDKPGQYKGVTYTGTRYRCNYCLSTNK